MAGYIGVGGVVSVQVQKAAATSSFRHSAKKCGSDIDLNQYAIGPIVIRLQSPRRVLLFLGMLIMTHTHSLSAEWLPVSIAPPDGDLEICVMDYDGVVLALEYPCHKNGADWVDASNKRRIDIQPTHWRKWTESH